MKNTNQYAELEIRLASLESRIASLRREMAAATVIERVEELAEIERLERHHQSLMELLRQLTSGKPDFGRDAKIELETMADDLSTTVEEYMKWIDSNYQPSLRPKRTKRPA